MTSRRFRSTMSRTGAIAVALLATAVFGSAARAADVAWINNGGGTFSTPTNWSTGAVPGPTDNAIITLDGTYTVTVDRNTQLAGLVVGGASGTQTLSLGTRSLTMTAPATIGARGVLVTAGGDFKAPSTAMTGNFNWSGGTLGGTTTISSGGKLNIGNGPYAKYLAGTVDNSGIATWTSTGSDSIYFSGTESIFNNRAGSVFNNNAGPAAVNSFNGVEFNNAGTVNGQTGTLDIRGSSSTGASTGTFFAAAGTPPTLRFSGIGPHVFNAGTRFTGPGTTLINGKVLVQGAVTVNGTLEMDNGNEIGGTGVLTVVSGANFNWKSGTISNTIIIVPGAKLNLLASAYAKYLAGTVNNSGIATWTNRSSDSVYSSGSGDRTFNNLAGGVFTNLAGVAAVNTFNGVEFNNTGTVNGQTGTLDIRGSSGTGTSTGIFFAAAGTPPTLRFSGIGPYTFNAGSRFTGTGTTLINGKVLVQGAATVSGTLEMDNGNEIGGLGVLTVASGANFNWKSGTLSGTLSIASGGKMNILVSAYAKYVSGIINNSGTATWTNRTADTIYSSGTAGAHLINNRAGGVFNTLPTTSGLATINGLDFVNAGVLNIGGNGLGTLNINNANFSQTSTGVINEQVAGLTAGSQFDQLNVRGRATLGGTVNVTTVGGFVPASGSTYKFITYTSHVGAFVRASGQLAGGRVLFVQYHATDATLAIAAAPSIASVSPTTAKAGTLVSVIGTNLTDVNSLKLNGESIPFTHVSATTLRFTVPVTSTSGKVTVTNSAGSATSTATLLVPPTITSFTPTSGPSSTSVRITGANFTGATSVKFGVTAVSATFTRVSATVLQASVPANCKSGPITVTTPGGTATSSASFTVTSPTRAAATAVSGAAVSAIKVNARTATIQLSFSRVLDAESASDAAHYSVTVNGAEVAVDSAGYNAATRTVVLGLSEGTVHAGDLVTVRSNALLDAQDGAVSVNAGPVTAG